LSIFPFFRRRQFFDAEERAAIVAAIRAAELQTSGEVRVYIESRCRFVNPLDRAAEIFFRLKMDHTDDRNAVLVYVAMKDRQLAIFGDQGIYEKTGKEYWDAEVKQMLAAFSGQHYKEGLIKIINDIGAALHHHFPYQRGEDKNELPDDIVFGK
jgi:uncharacterized membrane protein